MILGFRVRMSEISGIEEHFFQLLQIAVGRDDSVKLELSDDEWTAIYRMASEQSVLSVVLQAADILSQNGQKPPISLLYQWIGEGEQISTTI